MHGNSRTDKRTHTYTETDTPKRTGRYTRPLSIPTPPVPSRPNAKLTRLLRDCLGGTSKSTFVLTIGPCDRYKQETAGTLYFGFRAMAVKVDARIKEIYDPTKYIQPGSI